MEKTFRINELMDFYETLLSERQRVAMDMYYREDYSLNEIAENLGITKQAVSDNLKRAISNLELFEANLALLKKEEELLFLQSNLLQGLEELRLFSDDTDFQSKIENIKSLIK